MPGTFFGLEIARRGVMVHRKALDVTGHNVANANTEGYSRQEAKVKASLPYTWPDALTPLIPGQLGTGVLVEEVRRLRDYYLDVQYRLSGTFEGYWESRLDFAKQVQTIFPEPEGRGIQAVLLNFFNDWHDLNNNPQDPGIKKAVVESGRELADLFRQMSDLLDRVGDGIAVVGTGSNSTEGLVDLIGGKLKRQVDEINDLIQRITDITNTIIKVKTAGSQPNDLEDQRDLLLDQLSKYGRLYVTVHNNGALTVKFISNSDEAVVVSPVGENASTVKNVKLSIKYGKDGEKPDQTVLYLGEDKKLNLTSLAQPGTAEGAGQGSLLGTEAARLDIKEIKRQLDQLAQAIAQEVNKAAEIIDNSDPNITINFFVADGSNGTSDITAANIKINDKIWANPNLINGEEALAVARLRSTYFPLDGASVTFEGYYQSIVALVGARVESFENMLINQQAIGQQIDALRQSVSGVNIDEELTRVVQYQYGYQASARMVTVQDEFLDYIINRMGVTR